MNKVELQQALIKHHRDFISCISSLPPGEIHLSHNGKWSPIQQLDHIVRSVSPVKLAFSLPSPLLKLIFGSANRPSKSYEGLVEKYHLKLGAGGKASGRFIPNSKAISAKELSDKLARIVQGLSVNIASYSEARLDQLILPHPLLGKLTFREMLYFTIYHVQHHQLQVEVHAASHVA